MRHWLLSHLPAGLVMHPAEWFLAVLCFLSGLVIVAGVSQPGVIERLMWHPVVVGWGVSLIVGSLALMLGLSSVQWAPGTDLYIVKRIPIYRLGLRLLGLTSLAYSAAIAVVAGWNGAPAVAITLAFSGMCFIRLLSLGRMR